MTMHEQPDASAQFTEIVHAWLDATTAPFPDHLRSLVLREVAATPQRRRRTHGRLEWPVVRPVHLAGTAVIGILAVACIATAIMLRSGPQQAVSPGAASPSPSTMETAMPGEEVEPGVVKVPGDTSFTIAIGPDGTVWHEEQDETGAPRLRPLEADATAATLPLPEGSWRASFGPDGALWALSSGLARWDGDRWLKGTGIPAPSAMAKGLFVLDDGSALVPWLMPTDTRASTSVDGATVAIERTFADETITSRSDDLVLGSPGRSRDQHGRSRHWMGFATDLDGRIVAALPFGATDPSGASARLWQWDGQTWRALQIPEVDGDVRPWGVATGGDGSLWVYLSVLPPERSDSRALARLRDGVWTLWTDDDGVPRANDTEITDDLTVARDGTVWLPIVDAEGCAGLAVFDGTAWRSHLADYCITEIVPAPDGIVWASGFLNDESQEGGLFRIDPTAAQGS